jgi:hypothetical protein
MDQNELYETPAGMEDSGERLEKKEQLRAKVQALVSYYEEEKRRNEELSMELERLKAEQQQMQGMPLAGPAHGAPPPGLGMPPMNGMNGMNPPPAPGIPPAPGMGPMGAAPGGIPFSQRPPQAFPGMPAPGMPGGMPMPGPEFPHAPQGPQAPGGYTLQSFGAQQQQPGFGAGPQGFPPPRPPQPPQGPYGAPPPWQQQQPAPPFAPPFGQPGFPQQGLAPGAGGRVLDEQGEHVVVDESHEQQQNQHRLAGRVEQQRERDQDRVAPLVAAANAI